MLKANIKIFFKKSDPERLNIYRLILNRLFDQKSDLYGKKQT